MDSERAFPKALVVGFDAPPSDPMPLPLPSSSVACSSGSSSSSTARSLLTMLLKESQGSSASCTTLLQDAVDAEDCDTQSEASFFDDADEEDLAGDDDFVVTATEPITIVIAEPMQKLAEYWVSQRPVTNRRLQAEAPRK